MRSSAACHDRLRGYLDTVGLIDCHDHSDQCGPKYDDPIQVVTAGYFTSDLHSASSDEDIAAIGDSSRSVEERWPVLHRPRQHRHRTV